MTKAVSKCKRKPTYNKKISYVGGGGRSKSQGKMHLLLNQEGSEMQLQFRKIRLFRKIWGTDMNFSFRFVKGSI